MMLWSLPVSMSVICLLIAAGNGSGAFWRERKLFQREGMAEDEKSNVGGNINVGGNAIGSALTSGQNITATVTFGGPNAAEHQRVLEALAAKRRFATRTPVFGASPPRPLCRSGCRRSPGQRGRFFWRHSAILTSGSAKQPAKPCGLLTRRINRPWRGRVRQYSMSENTGGLRPLRTPQEALATAA
jgi:hypothetical protein